MTKSHRFEFAFAPAYRRFARGFRVTPGPYAFWKTAGPARLAITDRGLTFATNRDRGVLILFDSPVRGLDPLGILRHPELTVTVAEVDGLANLLRPRADA